jgi:hypothetical protein
MATAIGSSAIKPTFPARIRSKSEGELVFAKACEKGLEDDRVEADRQLLPQRPLPELESTNPAFVRR